MEHQVTISNHALEEMVLAAGESFVLGSALTDEREGAEIHGYLWGGRRTDESKDIEYIHIDKFSVSSSACGDEDSVWVDGDVARIKDSVLNLWAPHYHFLGDFHTHPYRDHDEVKENAGWQFSKRDIKSFRKDEQVWNLSGSNAPVMIVMAVTKMQNIHRTVLKVEADNRFMFNVGNLRFWLSIGIGKLGRGKEGYFRKTTCIFILTPGISMTSVPGSTELSENNTLRYSLSCRGRSSDAGTQFSDMNGEDG